MIKFLNDRTIDDSVDLIDNLVIALIIMIIALTGCAKEKPVPEIGVATIGAQGPAGTPGTQIFPVQFCPGFVQTYPSTFAESGFCIDGAMYGVYSANGGFLVYMPPGRYSSAGINASCTFTLGTNCEVTP